MYSLVVEGVRKEFGHVRALQATDLRVDEGEFFCLVGPSGSGKTTLLRIIAGLERASGGTITLGDRVMTRDGWQLPAEDRQVGLVFQNYAVWPHMTVERNVAFPLASVPLTRAEKREKVRDAIGAVGLAGLEERRPAQLSGGQLQRVALARALVTNPRVMLFDEPLSNLDARLRDEMRTQLRSWRRQLGLTVIYVTHDQAEAMALADRLAVMVDGVLQQAGRPGDVYREPANRFVAGFLGRANFIAGSVRGGAGEGEGFRRPVETAAGVIAARSGRPLVAGERVEMVVRPEDVRLAAAAAPGDGAWRIAEVEFAGPTTHYRLAFHGARIDWHVTTLGRPEHAVGSEVEVEVSEAWVLGDERPGAMEGGDHAD